jgi:hypothetical protein
MSLRVCLDCSTSYALGLPACPHCGSPTRNAIYSWEDDVAKANAFGSTHYVAEGQPVPADVPPGVRLVGPGAPPGSAPETAPEPIVDIPLPEPAAEPEDYAGLTILALRDLCRDRGLPVAGSKAELVTRLTQHDERAVA